MAEEDTRGFADEKRRLLGELELERNQLLRNIEPVASATSSAP